MGNIHLRSLVFLAVSACLLVPGTASAQNRAEHVATYRDWSVLRLNLGSDKDVICFAVTEPKDMSPKNVTHGNVFMMVANWKSGAATNQPSFKAGYKLRPRSKPSVRIGADEFEFYPSEDEAFIEASSDEARIVNAMKRGSTMSMHTTSARGTATTYVFSLLGATAALRRAGEVCQE